MQSNTRTRGWLLPTLIELDRSYQGRYELWRHTLELEAGEIPLPEPTYFLAPGEAGFDQTLAMVNRCLTVVEPNAAAYRTMEYLVEWLLFALGHPYQPTHPIETFCGQDKVSHRLAKTLNLELLIRCPSDYFGHILAKAKYGKNCGFYPTLQPVAKAMATVAVASARAKQVHPPYHGYDPCIGTGRLGLELSNTCRSLTGWERDQFLAKVALLNFVLYAPDFAYPIPALGGELIRGDALGSEGTSITNNQGYKYYPTKALPPLAASPIKPSRTPKEPASHGQLTLF